MGRKLLGVGNRKVEAEREERSEVRHQWFLWRVILHCCPFQEVLSGHRWWCLSPGTMVVVVAGGGSKEVHKVGYIRVGIP